MMPTRPKGENKPQLVSRADALEIDWPRSLGFFGIAAAVGVGLFIAAVPFRKMLDLPRLPNRARFIAQVFEGVAKPVGGDSEGTVRIVSPKGSSDEPFAGQQLRSLREQTPPPGSQVRAAFRQCTPIRSRITTTGYHRRAPDRVLRRGRLQGTDAVLREQILAPAGAGAP